MIPTLVQISPRRRLWERLQCKLFIWEMIQKIPIGQMVGRKTTKLAVSSQLPLWATGVQSYWTECTTCFRITRVKEAGSWGPNLTNPGLVVLLARSPSRPVCCWGQKIKIEPKTQKTAGIGCSQKVTRRMWAELQLYLLTDTVCVLL